MLESIPAIEPEVPETGAEENATIRSDITAQDLVETGTQKNAEPGRPEVDRQPGGRETGGPEGPEPTRFGDWERKGRCIDF